MNSLAHCGSPVSRGFPVLSVDQPTSPRLSRGLLTFGTNDLAVFPQRFRGLAIRHGITTKFTGWCDRLWCQTHGTHPILKDVGAKVTRRAEVFFHGV